MTIEQLILNHNIGVNLSDAGTFRGKELSEFSMVGHKHDAKDITGVMNQNNLPTATSSAKGIVQLSDSVNSDSKINAASSFAVNALRNALDDKAPKVHKHKPVDIDAGTFGEILVATSNTTANARQIRNILIGTGTPSNSVGSNGDIYMQYE